MSILDTIIVDTSTLIALEDGRLPAHGAVESLVLFEEVVLDGPTIKQNQDRLGWLLDINSGVRVYDLSYEERAKLYIRAAMGFLQIEWTPVPGTPGSQCPECLPFAKKPGDPSIWNIYSQGIVKTLSDGDPEITLEYVNGGYYTHSVTWSQVLSSFQMSESTLLADVLNRVPHGNEINGRLSCLMLETLRYFYYLAFQEQLKCSLLLHPRKVLFGKPASQPDLAHARRILEVFDKQVQSAYAERTVKWLGDEPRTLHLPLVTRFVTMEAERRGWSLGRTISWLRDQREVKSFREGIRKLDEIIASGDKPAIDTVLHDLEVASIKWSERIGAPTRKTGKVSLQVAIPFVSPAWDILVPLPRRTPAEKMLTLIGWLLNQS